MHEIYLEPGPAFATADVGQTGLFSNFDNPDTVKPVTNRIGEPFQRYEGYRARMQQAYPFHQEDIRDAYHHKNNIDEFIELFKAHGISPNTTDKLGNNFVHYAAKYNHLDLVNHVLADDYKDLVTTTNSNSDTPAHIAAQVGNVAALSTLLKAFPETAQQTNNRGETLIAIAVTSKQATQQYFSKFFSNCRYRTVRAAQSQFAPTLCCSR